RATLTENVGNLVAKIPDKPVVVGFGISSEDQVRQVVLAKARGVIVGSALAAAYMEGGKEAAVALAEKLQKACGEPERSVER
ncbi:MAG TPA: tryptophan synthase subunit alpha, partial [Candidatus Norongarragalinales archaeon]|nr:tryptophan synthase subunit alpha [Candidatus Norongarragalinales archaeon]